MFWHKKKEHIYVVLTRAVASALPKAATLSEIKSYLDDRNIDYTEEILEHALQFIGTSENNDGTRLLDPDYFFHLLEYDELTLAKKSSREAWWMAVIAIIISLLSLGFAWFGTSQVKLTDEQIKLLIGNHSQSSSTEACVNIGN